MVFQVLADFVVVIHFGFILFVVLGGLLAWRWRGLVRWHLPTVAWGLAIIAIGFTCPLTPLENALRSRAGQQGYDGGFIAHYIEGVIYPGSLTRLVQLLVAVVVIVSYVGLLVKRRPDRHESPRAQASAPETAFSSSGRRTSPRAA